MPRRRFTTSQDQDAEAASADKAQSPAPSARVSAQDQVLLQPSVIDRAGPNASAYMPSEGSAELARASYAHVRSEHI